MNDIKSWVNGRINTEKPAASFINRGAIQSVNKKSVILNAPSLEKDEQINHIGVGNLSNVETPPCPPVRSRRASSLGSNSNPECTKVQNQFIDSVIQKKREGTQLSFPVQEKSSNIINQAENLLSGIGKSLSKKLIQKTKSFSQKLFFSINEKNEATLKGTVTVETTKKLFFKKSVSKKIYTNAEYIASGAAGFVFAIKAGTKDLILKLEKSGPQLDSILTGNGILNTLLGDKKKVVGVVGKNKQVVEILNDAAERLIGAIQTRYLNNMSGPDKSGHSDFHGLDNRKKLEAYKQLSKGLAFLHKNGFHHGDIKPENLFFKFKGDKIQADIADLDDGKFLNDEDIINRGEFAFSPGYIFSDEDKFIDDFAKKKEIREKVQNGGSLTEEDTKFIESTDVYAMGASFKHTLFKQCPDPKDMFITEGNQGQFIKGTSTITNDQAAEMGISNKVKDFINSMLDENWEKRPSAEQVEKFFNNIKRLSN